MRDHIRMSPSEVDAFVDSRKTLVIATLGRNGMPHLAPMWFARLDGHIVFCTDRNSQKIVNLRRDPRMSVLVEAGEDYGDLRGVHMEGLADFTDDIEGVVDAVVERNIGPIDSDGAAAVRHAMTKRVAVIFRPTKVVSWDHRKMSLAAATSME